MLNVPFLARQTQIKSDWLNGVMRTLWRDKELILDFYKNGLDFGNNWEILEREL